MDEKKPVNIPVLAAAVALILVVVILIGVFALRQSRAGSEGIILPTVQPEKQEHASQTPEVQANFVQITPDNAATVLRSLQTADYYHQSFSVAVGTDRAIADSMVELWVSGRVIHAEINDGRKVKSILTDGDTAWLWYNVDPEPISVSLDGSVLAEDLLGLPNFNYLNTVKHGNVLEADYLVLTEPATQCIFVSVQSGEDRTDRYWINLANGLLYQADTLTDNQLIYQVRQNDFAQLADGDAAFQGKFSLPDGTEPFTAAARTRQP